MYHQCGRFEEAEALGEEVLKIHKHVLGECHPNNTLTSMGDPTGMYHQHGLLVSGDTN